MAVVSGGVVYGLTALARVSDHRCLDGTILTKQKYLVPHLQPPSTTAFQSTSAEITAQYDEAAKLLSELQEQTGRLQTTLDEDRYVNLEESDQSRLELIHRVRVNKVVSEVEEAVISVREAEESWRGEMREIRGEVESVRELVPRVRSHPFIPLQSPG
jgi:peroxin-14